MVGEWGEASVFERVGGSGQPMFFRFCPHCGSTVWWEALARPGRIAVAAGAFADKHFPPPQRLIWAAFGAFFPSSTKDAATRADPAVLTGWQSDMIVPCVAIGGITVETAAGLAAAGADFLAVSAGVWSYGEGPAAAVKAFNAEIAKGLSDRA